MVKKNFTRKDLAHKIFKKLGFSKNFSSLFVDSFFETLSKQLIENKKVKLTNFGTFLTSDKRERIGRNPKTKIEAKIKQRKVIKFKPSLTFKKKVNNNDKEL